MPKFLKNLGNVFEGTAYGVLNEFLAQHRNDGGFALPSRYEVIFYPPAGDFGNEDNEGLKNLASLLMPTQKAEGNMISRSGLRCESIEFPGRNLDTTADINLYGPERNIVSGYSYADITATFQCSNKMEEKTFFEIWQRLAFDTEKWNLEYYKNYVGKMEIFQLDQEDKRRYGVELFDCFPKTVAAQTATYQPSTEVQKVSVTFAYRYWKNLGVEKTKSDLTDKVKEVIGEGVEREIRSRIPSVLNKLF